MLRRVCSFRMATVVACTVALAGCASAPRPAPPGSPRVDFEAELAARTPRVDVETDAYSKITWVEAERVINLRQRDVIAVSLRGSGGGQRKAPSTGLRVNLESPNWAFLDTASDSDGQALQVVSVDRQVIRGGGIEETVFVVMTRQYLESRRASGIDVRVSGRRGAFVLQLPPSYVSGFLAKYDETMRGLGLDPMQ